MPGREIHGRGGDRKGLGHPRSQGVQEKSGVLVFCATEDRNPRK